MVEIIDTQLRNVAWQYAKLINARVTKTSLCAELETNPHFPTLSSLSKTFSKFNIPSKSYKIGPDDLHQLNPPFIALFRISDQDADFVIVTENTGNSVAYIYEGEEPKSVAKNIFFRGFKGIVWIAEPNTNSGETNYEKKLQQEKKQLYKRYSLIAGALFILLSILYANAASFSLPVFNAILVLKIIGCITGCLLLLYEVDKNNPVIKKICKKEENEKSGCDSVLNSKAAKIRGISLGELCFFYFTSSTILLLFPLFSTSQKISWLAFGNACSIPLLLFSLYYQWRVVKQWCRLCLIIASILVAELLCFSVFFREKINVRSLSISDMWIIGLCIILPVICWYLLKPFFIKTRLYESHSLALKRLENNKEVFYLLLQKQTVIYPGWEQLGIVVGNPAGSINIVIVSDPYCDPCAQAHKLLHDLVKQNSDVQLRIIFMSSDTETYKGATVAKHLIVFANSAIINDWYLHRNYNELAKKYPVSKEDIELQNAKLKEMRAWTLAAEISFTPTIFVNGYLLPGNYSPDDLKNII